ncbi:MAG: diguanylate cyclase [Burkholderiales bacterium]|nr:diguanylate cyclase [Burkholderiales bacterium]
MNKWGIRKRILFLAWTPSFSIAVLLVLYFTATRFDALEESLGNRGASIARQLAPASEYGVFSGNSEMLQKIADSILGEPDVRSVEISDNAGNILAQSENSKFPADHVIEFEEEIMKSQTQLDDFFRSGKEMSKRTVIGKVKVKMSRLSLIQKKKSLMFDALGIGLMGLLGGGLLAIRISRSVTVPILRLADTVEKLGKGALDTVVEVDSGGELGVLESGVSAMASKLKSMLDQRESYSHGLEEEVRKRTEELELLAVTDELTGLYNRRYLNRSMQEELSRCLRYGTDLSVCLMDVDHFKKINDHFGHQAGDDVLISLSNLLESSMRDTDIVGRYGGEEFAIVMPNTSLEEALLVADKIRIFIQKIVVLDGRERQVTVSIGVVGCIESQVKSLDELISKADRALYGAKDSGRNCVVAAL